MGRIKIIKGRGRPVEGRVAKKVITISLEPTVIQDIDEIARLEDTSRNQVVGKLLRNAIIQRTNKRG